MSSFLFDSLHSGLGSVLDLRLQQHSLTASNLANTATPGFKARYIPFDRILADAVGRGEATPMKRTHTLHVHGPGESANSPEIREIDPPPWAMDGNSVNAEREAVRLTENSLMYDSVAKGLSRRLAMLRYAASDGKG